MNDVTEEFQQTEHYRQWHLWWRHYAHSDSLKPVEQRCQCEICQQARKEAEAKP